MQKPIAFRIDDIQTFQDLVSVFRVIIRLLGLRDELQSFRIDV